MFVSPEVVAFRSDARTEVEAMDKITRERGFVANPNAIASPILMCEMAADRRGIDKEQAASVARHWWQTGTVPLTPTRVAGPDPTPPTLVAAEPVESPPIRSEPVTVEEPASTTDNWLARLPDELDRALAEPDDSASLVALIRQHGAKLATVRFAPDFTFESLRGATLLELMVALGRTPAIEALMAAGAQPGLANAMGVSALDLAADDAELLRMLRGQSKPIRRSRWKF